MTSSLILAGTAIAVTAMICLAFLRAWSGWIELKKLQIAQREPHPEGADPEVGTRIELAAVRERLKKLEAIASGVEL